MTVAILNVVDSRKEVQSDVVSLFEGLLAEAKSGEIAGVCFVVVRNDNLIGTAVSGTYKFAQLHSGVCTLASRIDRKSVV